MSHVTAILLTSSILSVWVLGLIFLGLFDLRLLALRIPSLSEQVWGGFNLLGLLIVGWSLIGPVFLTGHFWWGWCKPAVSMASRLVQGGR